MAVHYYHIAEGIMKKSEKTQTENNKSPQVAMGHAEIRQVLKIEYDNCINTRIGRDSLLKTIANSRSGRDTRR
ncbi:hypothetical protein [Candidatus Symbiopectobacterium sp. NZEC135]|uniref:hypothetical protein n=1 Tax=Candidatus Symbiopectobacterium sp. NZEC135 TaxID=2820471 RepID=UPI002225B937|nr:hypothetical protein [Candidatus Symbiopectobacterium sp. NZEC135]MCW2478850.1 hypothetical protein [Candidatus Symbiopectobacterium sp. NZEC135]